MCTAANIPISAGLFDIVDDMKPRIIKVDFPALPTGDDRSISTRVNGMVPEISAPFLSLYAMTDHPTRPLPVQPHQHAPVP